MNHEIRKTPVTYDNGTTGEMELKYPIKEKDKVYIVGCANCKDIVPWNDDAEFWGVNNLYGVPLEGAHYDRWFEIHNIWDEGGKLIRRGSAEFRGQPVLEYLKGVAGIGCTVYMQKHWPNLIPMSIPYPLEEVINFFLDLGLPLYQCRYLTNTISYEIALAIMLGFKEIQVYGVDMAVGTEYEHQRPSCEFWMGLATGLGIKIVIPDQNDLLKTRFMYGFEEKQQDQWNAKLEKIRVDMKKKRLALEQQASANNQAIQQYIGGEQVVKEVQKVWANLGDDLLIVKRGTI